MTKKLLGTVKFETAFCGFSCGRDSVHVADVLAMAKDAALKGEKVTVTRTFIVSEICGDVTTLRTLKSIIETF